MKTITSKIQKLNVNEKDVFKVIESNIENMHSYSPLGRGATGVEKMVESK